MEKSEYDELTSAIIGCAIEVHRILGPGLLESAYHECLLFELKLRGLRVYSQVEQPLMYKNQPHLRAYFIDLLVEDCVVVGIEVSRTNFRCSCFANSDLYETWRLSCWTIAQF
jgi:GxxExxY protein